ncbi:MAG: hypothetical protein PHI73_03680 [Patescibacteria group bacterium]|nr:hypothetical protein [Patescibacteria group bacterium]
MKKILLLVILVPFVTFGCSLQQNKNDSDKSIPINKNSQTNSGYTAFTKGDYFTFEYPSNWSIWPSETGDYVDLESFEKVITNNVETLACEVILSVQPNPEKLSLRDWIVGHSNTQNEIARKDSFVAGQSAIRQLIQNKGNEFKDFIASYYFEKGDSIYYFYSLIKVENIDSADFQNCDAKFDDIVNSVKLKD